jgi:DNA invertase Pin-like site-specific DNA recombinase
MNIGYIRTSNDEINPENQKMKLRDEVDKNLIIFSDISVSGFKYAPLEREGFRSMLKFINENKVEKVYTFEISRIGRTWKETYDAIKELENKGVMLVSLSPTENFLNIEDKAIRDIILHILSWVAEREHDNMIERTKQGIKRHREEYGTWGKPSKEIDWVKVKKYKNEGMTWTEISRKLGVSLTTLNKQKFDKGFERDKRGRK